MNKQKLEDLLQEVTVTLKDEVREELLKSIVVLACRTVHYKRLAALFFGCTVILLSLQWMN